MEKLHLNTVNQISDLILEVSAIQKPYVEGICSRCASPCCLRVRYVYSGADIRFLTLAGRKRKWSGKAFLEKGCWFLGPSGCTVDPVSRPLLCHSYLCPELEAEIRRHAPCQLTAMMRKFKRIAKLRRRLYDSEVK